MISITELSKQEPPELGSPEPKIRKLADVVDETHETYEQYKERAIHQAPEYKSPVGVRVRTGLSDSLRQMTYTPEGIKIMYGQAKMAIGGMSDNEEMIERGKALIQSMNMDIDQQERYAFENRPVLTKKDMESFGYGLGGGLANYGVMIAAAYLTGGLSKIAGASTGAAAGVAETTGLGANFLLEATGRLQQSLNRYKEKYNDPELKTLTPEVAGKNLAYNLIYATGSTILEKKMGFGQQVKIVKTPLLTKAKKILLNAASEGGTELTQSLLNIGIDLVEGQINWENVPEEIKGAIMEGAIGATLGGGAGIALSTSSRSAAINAIKENINKVVPEDKLDVVANAIFESGNDSMSNIIATEITQSSELRAKRGEIYNSFVNAAQRAMLESGGYSGMTESEISQLAIENANMFADQVLAEANKRNVVVDDVIKASDILYDPKTKELRLAPKGDKQGQLLFQEANDVAQRINEIDAEEAKNGVPEYTAPTININGVERQTTNSNGEPVAKSEKSLRYFYDWFGDSKVVDEQGRPLVVYHGTKAMKYGRELPEFDTFSREKSRSLQNRVGFFFGQTEEFASNFGDRVMPVYLNLKNPKIFRNGTPTQQELSLEQKAVDTAKSDDTKYVAQRILNDSRKYTDSYERFVADIYHKSDMIPYQRRVQGNFNDATQLGTEESYQIADKYREILQKEGYDGVIIQDTEVDARSNKGERNTQFVAFNPNQIKSTSNRGTFSSSENIYLQSAYAGSRVDYDKPSLEAIGSGEGNQAHGWGLYYALDKDVADGYRETFTQDKFVLKYGGKTYTKEDGAIFDALSDTWFAGSKEDALDGLQTRLDLGQYEDFDERDDIKGAIEFLKGVDANKIELVPQGQVHEVDIPESPYLLDENKSYENQSDYVKEKLQEFFKDKQVLDLIKSEKGKYAKSQIKFFFENKSEDYSKVRELNELLFGTKTSETTQENARLLSELLYKHGIKGITYFGEQDGRCFVIFNPDDVKVIQKFYQRVPQGKAKGLFDQKSKVIKLFEKADASTLPHELSHYWLDNMWSYATSGLASETYLAQFQAVKDFLGVSPNQKYLTPNQHEKFASAYEKYIHRGIIPNSLMGNVFDDYERFIRKVYDSIEDITYATRKGERKAVKLTPDIIKFFDSMITGGIDVVKANELVASQMNEQEIKKAVENNVREAKQVVAETEVVHKENRQNVMTPVKTDTKTSYLTAYEKMTDEKVEAGAVELAKEMEKAEQFVSEDLERAKRIVNGEELPPENMLKNTIYLAYNEVQKKLGNTQERAESMLNQALELHRYGQEISSQQLAYNSTFQKLSSAQYWMDRTISNLEDIASKKANMPAEELSQKIKSAVQEGVNQGKTAEEIAKQIADETGLVLYQTEELPKQEFENKTAAYNYVYKYVNERLGLSLTKEQALEITRRADEMMQSLENSIGDYGNPSADYFRKLSDMEAYANSLAPSSALRIYTDLIGPTNLMASVKTPAFNIIANVPVLALRIAGRRAKIGQMTSIVPKENIKQYLKRSSEIFRETGYNLSTMTTDTPQKTILGEKITHFNETSKLQKAYADFLKYGIGYGDLIFKDFAFVDSVALQATKEANGNESKAVELFNDAVRVEPTTDIGKQIRLEAQTDALVSTYQNEGAFAGGSLKIRSGIDKMTFGLLGKFFIPFAKTPGNVIGYSAEKAFGPAVELAKGIITGKVDKPKLKMLMAESALAYFLSAALVFLGTDDDDYMPPYALADEKTKQVARELNIPYNSIRIGNTWYSLDIIGPLGAIVSGFLQARRDEGIIGTFAAFLSGTLLQLGSIPGLGGVSNITEGVEKQIEKIKQNKGEEAGLEMIESVTDALYSRTVPAFVSDVAKVIDQYEREAKGFQKIQKKIPFARNLLEEKISKTTGQAEPRGEPITRIITDILAGARIKEQIVNDIADEVFRLNSVGEGVNLSDITRSGDLAKLSDEQRRDALIMFAQEYSQKVGDLIKTSSYKSKTDEGKKDAINDVRRAIVKKIKSKYSKELKVLQKKR